MKKIAQKSIEEIADLIKKYDVQDSYYTDYPPSGLWTNTFSEQDYKKSLESLISEGKNDPILLYFHFPFCPRQCFYCTCYSSITNNHEKVKDFLNYQFKEIDMLHDFFKKRSFTPNIKEVHFGGGSPSFMNEEEMDGLIKKISSLVKIEDLAEFSIEIDPRTVDKKKMMYYHEKGINRISLGIQDFDPKVQKAINRVQPLEMIEGLISPDIRNHFKSINFDLIYGLPYQTRKSWRNTIETVKKLSPDRFTSYVLGYRPDLFRHQKFMNSSEMPDLRKSAMMNIESIQNILNAGYERIGIDHYSKPTDDLAIAKKKKTLLRTSMGYTAGRCKDIMGFGPSGMGAITNHYSQNIYSIQDYCDSINNKKFPIFRGYNLTNDDVFRRDVIYKIISYSNLDFKEIEQKYNIEFSKYFKEDLELLNKFIQEGMVELSPNALTITPLGEFFHRHICACFDKKLREGKSYKHSRQSTE